MILLDRKVRRNILIEKVKKGYKIETFREKRWSIRKHKAQISNFITVLGLPIYLN